MDYEKKYNEALERASHIKDNNTVATPQEVAEHIFPELRESDDERIRKYLVEELKAAKSVGELKFIIPQPTREECITYLERQKEQKSEQYSPLCNTVKDKIREYITNHFVTDTVVKTDVKSIVKAMEEGVRLGREECRPTEWSEEDRKHLNSVLLYLNRPFYNMNEQEKSDFDWLKSLRPSWKPSDEQMEELKEASAIMKCDNDDNAFPSLKILYEQLKKL